ncbi:MnhB domain-containing protein [Haloarcula nitratireducens]|uniref:Sodium:proton antiporter n=1 Tax=Haloarcula nitratireducens TaxID=2487749 RepID=A0AAW4PDQ9_9EURY|nr:MnhB domain-containing protein [Halomicroarcula nitratireducens]MBX0295882.1 sodium:proton antiporter [Halomicroarcula nitratireducens]
MTTTITRTTIRVVVPIVLVVAILLLLQGHKLPGGGFIGGVLTTAALVLVYVAYGLDYVEMEVLDREVESGGGIFERRIVTAYRRLFSLGLGLAVTSGVAGLVFGEPFLSQSFVIFHDVPIYHEVELASALLFDLGIYGVVVGGLLTIVSVVGAE